MTGKSCARIEEIFTSIQGEGPYIGCKQLFIRFCGCNLSCTYCDTETGSENATMYKVDELANIINSEKNIHSVSITGGEPLLHSDFLVDLFSKISVPVYLETNGTLYKELENVIDLVDVVSADVKLESASGLCLYDYHEKFLEVCVKHNKEVFIKIVFDENLSDDEIVKVVGLARKYGILLVLQPMMKGEKIVPSTEFVEKIFDKFSEKYFNVRLIPQTHKFLSVR